MSALLFGEVAQVGGCDGLGVLAKVGDPVPVHFGPDSLEDCREMSRAASECAGDCDGRKGLSAFHPRRDQVLYPVGHRRHLFR